MVTLNLPQIDYNIRKNTGKAEIFDVIRRKYVALTPEEWVRQHMIHFLLKERHYPKGLMKVESGLDYHKRQKRSDILVYNREAIPLLVVECKTFQRPLTQAAMTQAAVYNKSLRARYLIITNGLKHYCAEVREDSIRQLTDIPYWKEEDSEQV